MHGKELNNDGNVNSNHNFFFSKIVSNKDEDFIGFVAYTIYKKNKIEYIEQFKKDNSRLPTDNELLKWQHEECTDGKIKDYRSLTESKVNKFINELQGEKEKELRTKKEEIEKQKKKNLEKTSELNKREKRINERDKYCTVKSKYQFVSGILQSFIATLIYVVLGYIFIKCGDVDLLSELINTTSK
jgi:hypothetical protein